MNSNLSNWKNWQHCKEHRNVDADDASLKWKKVNPELG